MEMKQGDKVELRDGFNLYKVVEAHGAFAFVECTHFVKEENLGDGIMCKRQGQQVWIATYHAWKFQDASYRPV